MDEKSEVRKKKPFSIYALAKGKPGKKFTIKEFLTITKNAKKKPGGPLTDGKIMLDDGYVYEADSKQEITALKKLIYHKAFKRLRGQCIAVPYRYKRKINNYYPDFILLTQTNKIIVIEIKSVSEMNTKLNKRKYYALRKYCNEHGYLYLMCDRNFVSFETLEGRSVSIRVAQAIEKALEEKGYFDLEDYNQLFKQLKKNKNWLQKHVGIYLAQNSNLKMMGDLERKSSDFKIMRKRGKK